MKCFANPAKDYIQDAAIEAEGQYIGQITGKTLAQLQAEDPDIQLMDIDEFISIIEQRATTDPEEITEDRYWDLLGVLPPWGWHRGGDTESFYMSEFLNGRVTTHVVRLGDRYFSFNAPVMTRHADRVAKVRAWLGAQEVQA